MNRIVTLVAGVGVAFGLFSPSALAQPKPGPEHEMLKKYVGDWDATIAFGGQESKGQAKYTLGYGGFWLMMDFKGDFGGMAFQGRGQTGYDPHKKKYVSTWVDNMEPVLTIMEGEFSKDGKTFTEKGEGTGMDGNPVKMKSVHEFKDKETILFTIYQQEGDKDQERMKITYKRKK